MARPKTKPIPTGSRRGSPLSVADVRRAGAQARALLDLVDRSDKDLTTLGISEAAYDELETAASRYERFRMPSCRALMAATLGGGLTKDVVLLNYNRAMMAIHGFAPAVAYLLAWKMDDENAPGSTKVLLAVAAGIGLLQPAEAVSTHKRLDALDMEKLRERARTDPAGMKAELLASAT